MRTRTRVPYYTLRFDIKVTADSQHIVQSVRLYSKMHVSYLTERDVLGRLLSTFMLESCQSEIL